MFGDGNMFWIWLVIIIFLVFIEIITVNLTTIWFVVSGLIALVLSFFIDTFEIQFATFVIGGIILLFTTRPYLVRKLQVKEVKTNLDRVIGMQGVVTMEITKLNPGEVKVDGKLWIAIADKKIKKDTVIEVLNIDGVKLKVKESD